MGWELQGMIVGKTALLDVLQKRENTHTHTAPLLWPGGIRGFHQDASRQAHKCILFLYFLSIQI